MLVALGLLRWCNAALADGPPTEPLLRLETGMHVAPIRGIDVDNRSRVLLTVSNDKTARLWSLGDGRLIRVLRPPIGDSGEGELRAGALSPDGAVAAVGGWTGEAWDHAYCVYLFDTASGKLLRRLTGLPDVLTRLAFSPDGGLLAAGLAANGVQVWRTGDWSIAWSDTNYGDQVYGLAFNRSGELVASSLDGYLRSYDIRGKLRQPKVKAPGGTKPFSVAISPDGELVAVGYYDKPRVDLLGWRDLRLLASPDVAGITDPMTEVAWSASGSTLFAGNTARSDADRGFIRVWSDGGRGAHRDVPVADDTILGLVPLAGSDMAFASGEPSWGVLRDGGRVDLQHVAATAFYETADDGFRISPDGKQVRFGFERFGKRPAAFTLAERGLIAGSAENAGLTGASTSEPGMKVDHWREDRAPTLNNRRLGLDPYELSHAVAVNGERLLMGTEWSLRLFDKAGAEIWSRTAPTVTASVNITPDGRLAVASFGDGTIRWYRMRDGVELLALFPHLDGKRWVAWTPQGYYDASAGGDELIGWHVNRGADQEADFFPARQFSEQFNRPDIIALVLDTLDVDGAVRQANMAARRKAPAPVIDLLPPVVKILSPPDLSSVVRSPIDVTYLVRSPTPVTKITVLVDGRPVETAPPTAITSGAEGSVASVSVPMPQHNAKISLVAANAQTTSEAAVVNVGWQGEKDWYKPDLYVLAVGVAHYKDASLTLKYSAKDAADFAIIARAQAGGLYNHVEVRELEDEHATLAEIRKGLSWLRTTPARDSAMLFLSGHGQNDADGSYHYLPYDADQSDLDATTILDSDIDRFLGKVPGKVFAFLDTCFAGGVGGKKGPTQPDIDRLANKLASAEKGIVVFTSSTGRQFSLEKDEWKNGAFTKALVEALKGGADYQHDKSITIAMLEVYLSHRVQELTNGEQSPTSAKPKTIPDLAIARVVP
ncbi:MAG TPA: caspase family protein [Acetobacteraceae bacterium]|nr:caspase family protein [Acetobacteraceae bacterium]